MHAQCMQLSLASLGTSSHDNIYWNFVNQSSRASLTLLYHGLSPLGSLSVASRLYATWLHDSVEFDHLEIKAYHFRKKPLLRILSKVLTFLGDWKFNSFQILLESFTPTNYLKEKKKTKQKTALCIHSHL